MRNATNILQKRVGLFFSLIIKCMYEINLTSVLSQE